MELFVSPEGHVEVLVSRVCEGGVIGNKGLWRCEPAQNLGTTLDYLLSPKSVTCALNTQRTKRRERLREV